MAQAKLFGAELILLKVIHPLLEGRDPKTEQMAHKVAREQLKPTAARIQEEGNPVEIVILEEGRPHLAILDYAESNRIDLIVMCTYGYSAFNRWLMGSIADRVVCGSNIPVLVVRAQEKV
jgi:nucleotide-binding universal stress UspA family protein